MPDYRYLAIDPAGRERRGQVAAADRDAARAILTGKQLFVIECAPAPAGGGERPRGLPLLARRAKRLSGKELALFTRQLATLTEVSPLEEALRTVTRQSEAAHVRTIVGSVQAGIVEGQRLADAMRREAGSFPPLYRAMISAGEASGSLPDILSRLSDLLERQAEVRGKLVASLAYPVVLAVVAMVVVAALMIWVVPKVVEQFDTIGQQLPLLTRAIIALSTAIASWWWLALILIAIIGFGVATLLRRPAVRLAVDARLLRLPLFGRLIRDLHAARFARTLGTMVASRLPLVDGLRLTLPTISNHALRRATEAVIAEVRAGGSLSAAMRSAAIYPPLLVYLVASGESSGRLDHMLARAADYLEREFDRFTATAMALIEPAIIVAMGVIVALIVLSILLPILQLQQLTGP